MYTTRIGERSTKVNGWKSIMRLFSLAIVGMALLLVFWFLAFGGLVLGAYHNDKARTFDDTHVYKPVSGAYRQVELHATGNIEAGGDSVVSNSLMTISITTNDVQTFVKKLRYSYDDLLKRDETYVRVSATPSALAAWMKSLPVQFDEETLPAEAQELSAVIFGACNASGSNWGLRRFR